MTTNGSFYQDGLPISSVETGLGNVPAPPVVHKTAESSFYLSGSVYQTLANQDQLLALLTADTALTVADLVLANVAAANAAASAAAAVVTLASSLKIAQNLADLSSVPTALVNLGLQNVTNTSDINKPVSTAQATADALVASNAATATALKANTASPTLTGVPAAPTAAPGTATTQLATTAFVDAARVILAASDALKAPLASPTLTGVPVAPTAAPGTATTQLATTAFVDAARVILVAVDALKAPLASPALTGTPTAPTATVGTNTTQLATTAFVLANATSVSPATVAPLIDGTAAVVGTSLLYARQDHVHPTDTSRAALASPTFTGVPSGPTATVGTNTTQLATTAFVLANSSASGVSSYNTRTGAVVPLIADNPVSLGGTGVPNLLGFTSGLQALKLSTSLIGVNPGTWANNVGTQLFNTTSVLTADLTLALPNFTSGVGAQVSGALSNSANGTDGTEVFLYLIHRNSDGKVMLIGSSSDTQGSSQTFTATAAAPGVITTPVAHGLRKRMAVYVSNSGGALPAPLGSGIQYYVCTVPSPTTFTLSTSIANVNTVSNLTFTTTGSGTNTVKWGVQNDMDFQLGAGVATFDRRHPYFAFVWNWTNYGGIPNFTTPQGSTRTLLTSMTETTAYGLTAQTPGAYTAISLAPWLANINRQVLIRYFVFGNASGGTVTARTTSSGGNNTLATVGASVSATGTIELTTDSTGNIDIGTTGTAQVSIFVAGWSQMDPS